MNYKATVRSGGFTLIELLVVIVIVGVLAGLLMSVVVSVRENGRATQCVSNMRQIYSALSLYTQDHANTLPQRMYPNTDSQGKPIGYPEVILGYIDPGTTPETSATAQKLFLCPSQTKSNYPQEPGYGMNWYYDNLNISLISQPAQTILLTDTLGSANQGSRRADRDNVNGDIGKLDDKRHRGQANYLFFDGHLNRMTYADTRKPISSSTDNPPPDLWGTNDNNHTQPNPTPPYGGG